MKISGSYTFDAPRAKVWTAIYDLTALLEIIPGCQGIQQPRPGEYRGQIQLRLPAVVGSYQTYVKLLEAEPPRYSRFEGEVDGTLGLIKGTALFRLKELEGQTLIEYEGQGLISGSLAQLDSRFAEGLAKNLINQGLVKLNKKLQDQEDI